MKNKAKALVLSAALLSSTANAIDLSGTIFDKAAKAYNLDPLLCLLYTSDAADD
ncbi:hypothetical protein, partial [Klebsiella pneumoniae]|uniref:hypothetical protein n=1 Tax=Klebsiella pneumoniae TaxID=573 RepID=UPI000AD6FDFE